jgi:hypothetical protein
VSRRWIRWTLLGGLTTLVVLAGLFAWYTRPAKITRIVQQGVSERLGLDATFEEVRVNILPRPSVSGRGVSLRLPDRPDLPPFVAIDEFQVNVGVFSLMREHVDTVYAKGLRIAIPPPSERDGLSPEGGGSSEIIIDHLITEGGSLQFIPSEPDKRPLTFDIHAMHLQNVGVGVPIPFEATLTNPVPEGLVEARGEVGPFVRGQLPESELSGTYVFTDADLATINGIGGILQSTGTFGGTIRQIAVNGRAEVADFSLDLGGTPMPLTADFDAVVTGTNGTTVLERVDAVLRDTPMAVSGAVLNLSGPDNRALEFEVTIQEGRIEDILTLVIDSQEPVMTGQLAVEARMKLPPGPTPVSERLEVEGDFGLTDSQFTGQSARSSVAALSRRSLGQRQDEAAETVMTDLTGRIRLADGIAHLTNVRFEVPGARVSIAGTYALQSGALNFQGELRMQASMSQAVGGFKSFFLRPFNPLFRKDGAGAVIPIRIEGTREEPKFGLRWGDVF